MDSVVDKLNADAEWFCKECGMSHDTYEDAMKHENINPSHTARGEITIEEARGILKDYACIPREALHQEGFNEEFLKMILSLEHTESIPKPLKKKQGINSKDNICLSREEYQNLCDGYHALDVKVRKHEKEHVCIPRRHLKNWKQKRPRFVAYQGDSQEVKMMLNKLNAHIDKLEELLGINK